MSSSAGPGSPRTDESLRDILARVTPDAAGEAPAERYPWVRLLPREELPRVVADLRAAARIDAGPVLTRTIHEWEATAAIYADPVLLARLTGAVPDPRD